VCRDPELERGAGYQIGQKARYDLGLTPQFGGTVGGVRASVLKAVGGWNPNSLTEDTDLTFRLLLKGWKVAYVNRAECYEEAPETWEVRSRQIRRWARGHTQVMIRYFGRLLRLQHQVPHCQVLVARLTQAHCPGQVRAVAIDDAADVDETPYGIGKDSPGVTSTSPDSNNQILYVTIRTDMDEWISPADSAVLDGAGDAAGHVQLGTHGLPAEPDLMRIAQPAAVHDVVRDLQAAVDGGEQAQQGEHRLRVVVSSLALVRGRGQLLLRPDSQFSPQGRQHNLYRRFEADEMSRSTADVVQRKVHLAVIFEPDKTLRIRLFPEVVAAHRGDIPRRGLEIVRVRAGWQQDSQINCFASDIAHSRPRWWWSLLPSAFRPPRASAL
jgi:hypothetical protein